MRPSEAFAAVTAAAFRTVWWSSTRSILAVSMAVLTLAFGLLGATAQSSQWELATNREGLVRATLLSTNSLSVGSGVIDYHPALVLSCKQTRNLVWRQAIQLRAALSRDASTTVTLRFDGAAPFQETWIVDENNLALFTDGQDSMARLARALRLSVSWSKGVFSRSGEVIFDLGGIKEAVAKVAESCGVKPPFPMPGQS